MKIEWEPVDQCPFCGGKGIPSIENYDYEIQATIHVYHCPYCRCSYHNPRMSQKSMNEYYKSGIYREHGTRSSTEQNIISIKSKAVIYKTQLLEGFRSDMDVRINRGLDYGCGKGYLVKELRKKYGEDIIGYDLYCDPNAEIDIITNKEEITGTFDLITCVHTLEHLPYPIAELNWMVSKLNKDGILFIEIPFIKLVFPPHPIMFSREAVYRMMAHLKARYIFYDLEYINGNGLIFAQPNHPTVLDTTVDYYSGLIGYIRRNSLMEETIE